MLGRRDDDDVRPLTVRYVRRALVERLDTMEGTPLGRRMRAYGEDYWPLEGYHDWYLHLAVTAVAGIPVVNVWVELWRGQTPGTDLYDFRYPATVPQHVWGRVGRSRLEDRRAGALGSRLHRMLADTTGETALAEEQQLQRYLEHVLPVLVAHCCDRAGAPDALTRPPASRGEEPSA